MVRVEVDNGKVFVIVGVSEGVNVTSSIEKDNITKLIQQLKAAQINTTEPANAEG